MKKVIAIFLVMCVAPVLFACNKGATNTSKENNKETVNTQATPKNQGRAYGESPEEVATLFASAEYKGIQLEMISYVTPGSDMYLAAENADDNYKEYFYGKKPFLDGIISDSKSMYAEKGKTIADEKFMTEFYKKACECAKLTVHNVREKGDNEVSVVLLVENGLVEELAPDFSTATFENSDIEQLVKDATIESLYYAIGVKRIDGEWYVDELISQSGTLIECDDYAYTIVEK